MTGQRRHKLERREVEDLLETHANALASGKRPAHSDVPTLPDDISLLFGLSDKLFETLRPINPSSEFVEGLKGNLSNGWVLSTAQRERLLALLATMGIVVSILAASALLARAIGFVIAVLRQLRRSDLKVT